MSRKRAAAALSLLTLIGGTLLAAWWFGWFPFADDDEERPRGFGPRVEAPDEHYSNILPADYVGPQTCAKCHEQQHKLWSGHPHRFMNQLPTKAAVKGDFANHVWKVRPGYAVTFSTEDGSYFMTVNRPAEPRTRYKVTRTVGSRFMQFYIGVQTEGPNPGDKPVFTTEHRLPFAYWFRMKRWLPQDYFDVGDDEPEELADGYPVVGGVDAKTSFIAYTDSCVQCHNTYPHAYRLFRPGVGGFPDAVLDPDRRALSAALASHKRVAPTADAFEDLPYRLDPNKDLVTVGISCESCHLGGREHATLQKDIAFFPANPHLSLTSRTEEKPFTGKRRNPATSQGICAQCHSAVAVSSHPNGSRTRNSAEARDLLGGACATKIRCVTCHEPHTPGIPSGGPTQPAHLAACTQCHPQYAAPEQAAAHSRHAAATGVDCLDCHMPRISQGIDEVSRTHRISMPVEQSMISTASLNACNLCHLDKPVRWSLAEMKRGWGRDIVPLDTTPPDCLDQPAGQMWLKSSRSIDRIVAIDAYARSPLWKSHVPQVLRALNDENTVNRSFGLIALERILGRPVAVSEIDILAGPVQRRKQIEGLQGVLEGRR